LPLSFSQQGAPPDFNELLLLSNEEGAKKVICKYPDDLASVPFLKGEIDIDTQEGYKRLTNADR